MDTNHGISQPHTPTTPTEDLDSQAAPMALETMIPESTVQAIRAHYVNVEQIRRQRKKKNKRKATRAPTTGPAPPPTAGHTPSRVPPIEGIRDSLCGAVKAAIYTK